MKKNSSLIILNLNKRMKFGAQRTGIADGWDIEFRPPVTSANWNTNVQNIFQKPNWKMSAGTKAK